jgi:hypothetical protein
MNFTKTDNMEAIMLYYLYVDLLIISQGNRQVHEQVKWQLSGQISPIPHKIFMELCK